MREYARGRRRGIRGGTKFDAWVGARRIHAYSDCGRVAGDKFRGGRRLGRVARVNRQREKLLVYAFGTGNSFQRRREF